MGGGNELSRLYAVGGAVGALEKRSISTREGEILDPPKCHIP